MYARYARKVFFAYICTHHILTKNRLMTEQEKIASFPLVVEPMTDDVSRRLSWHTLGHLLLDCAGKHSTARGFGYKDIGRRHQVWVVSRIVMEFTDRPSTGESYVIDTFITRIYRQFTDRMFTLHDGHGTPYGHAFTTWAVIDYDTRQPVSLCSPEFAPMAALVTDRTVPIAPPARIRVGSSEPVATHRVAFSDLDRNGHMNSIRYIDILLDTALTDTAANIRRIDIAYAREARFGDELLIYREGDQYEIRLADGTVAVRAALTF